jgi:subtilisin family serine protease
VPSQVVVGLTLAPPADVARVVRDLESGLGLRRVALAGLPLIATELVLFEIRSPQTVAAAVIALGADPRVLFAEPNFLFATTAEHSDPMAGLQYGPALLGVPRAHDHATGRGVRVAVIDTGIDAAHPDLADRVALRANFAEGADAAEIHGTAIAGVIAAPLVRRSRGVGCAWFPYANTCALRARASVATVSSARSPGA